MRHLVWAVAAIAIVCVGAGLTACNTVTPEPRVEVREVKVPVAAPCAKDPGPDPTYADTPDALRAATDIFERVRLLLAGRAQRDARLAELKAASAGCF